MAKGRDKHLRRLDDIGAFGKDLARRSGRKCELCEGKGDLRTYDTEPEEEPTMDTLILACERCRTLAAGQKHDARELRFLETAAWHELPQIAQLAKKILQNVDADWARNTLEMLS